MKKKVIIDCDPGIDDCIALLLCIQHLDVLGITVVGGNVPLKFTEKNARYMTEITGKTEIPVYAGYDSPMFTKLTTAPEVHGSGGLGSVSIQEPQKKLEKIHAVDYLIEMFMENEDITLITLGPLTNVAQALLKEPRLRKKIPEIYMMGGSATAGNYNATAEFNIYVDPEAANIVFGSGIPIRMAGLNLTRQNCMVQEDVSELEEIDNEPARFTKELLTFTISQNHRSSLCDACAVVWLIQPDIIKKSLPMYVTVETKGEYTRGMTVCDYRDYMGTDPEKDIMRKRQFPISADEPNTEVAMEFDSEKFRQLLFSTMKLYGNK